MIHIFEPSLGDKDSWPSGGSLELDNALFAWQQLYMLSMSHGHEGGAWLRHGDQEAQPSCLIRNKKKPVYRECIATRSIQELVTDAFVLVEQT